MPLLAAFLTLTSPTFYSGPGGVDGRRMLVHPPGGFCHSFGIVSHSPASRSLALCQGRPRGVACRRQLMKSLLDLMGRTYKLFAHQARHRAPPARVDGQLARGRPPLPNAPALSDPSSLTISGVLPGWVTRTLPIKLPFNLANPPRGGGVVAGCCGGSGSRFQSDLPETFSNGPFFEVPCFLVPIAGNRNF